MRAELSEPMIRRNRIIRLDYMKPDRMFLILEKFANDYQCDSGLLNLVLLMYENMYKNREVYRKLPSCSECKQAIMDAHILLRSTGFSKTDMYQNISGWKNLEICALLSSFRANKTSCDAP